MLSAGMENIVNTTNNNEDLSQETILKNAELKSKEDMTLSLSIQTFLTVMFSLQYPTCTCEEGILRRLKRIMIIIFRTLASGSTGAGMIDKI
jgi:hypothetical protein